MRVAAIVVGFLCALGAAEAADLSQVGPDATAHALIAARPAVKEPGFEFVYAMAGGGASGTMTVDMAQDFTVVTRSPTVATIYDYALRRILTIDDESHDFQNISLYAMVDFFAHETANRRYLRGVMAQLHTPADTNEPFWVQSELHVMDPEDGVPKIVRRAAKDGSVRFLYAGKEVASYSPSKQALTPEQGAAFARVLRMNSNLHPTIIAAIVASGHLPQRLTFALAPILKKPLAVWTLQSAAAVQDAYPLQSGAHPVLLPPGDAAAAPLAPLLPVMRAAIAGTAPGMKTAAQYHALIEAALAKQKLFQAALLALELNLQYGAAAANCASPCHGLKDVFTIANGDVRVQALLKALQPANGAALDASIQALTDLKRDDLSNAYVVDDFLANDLVEAGHPDQAIPLFAGAIKANPYLFGFYKDMGDAYRLGYDPVLAWLCYDMGRSLPGAATSPLFADMPAYEADLVKKYPQFF
ncbi:MAG TPA: hypothetical protein VHU87_14770 [Rhizomicrobium sp.]|nr:hypothetical protein [Rhizomicrobium sp.]